jgi:hypothetical protein
VGRTHSSARSKLLPHPEVRARSASLEGWAASRLRLPAQFPPRGRAFRQIDERFEISADERFLFRAAPPFDALFEQDGVVKAREPVRPHQFHGSARVRVRTGIFPSLMLLHAHGDIIAAMRADII